MSYNRRMLHATTAAVALITFAAPALAQETPPAEETQTEDRDVVVVTGTQIRGVAPVGTNVIGLSREDIIATGALSANDVLTSVPQVTSAFLDNPTVQTGGGLSLIRPNIRQLGASGTNTTLVLIDGHRAVGAGVLQTTADPDVIPPGVLERVEVMPDGGSSIYGSDAIGGVVNFITRKRFEGLEAVGHYGIGDEYTTFDVNLTGGVDWTSGGAYLSYVYAENDEILGRDRDYVRQTSDNSRYCSPGTIEANGTTYVVPNGAPGTTSQCDNTDDASLWPALERQSVFGVFNQDFTDTISLDVRSYFTRRELTGYRDLVASQPQDLSVTAANAFFNPVAGETSQIVRTSFAGVFDNSVLNRLDSFGITPTLTADLGGDWQLRLMGNFGRSTTTFEQGVVDEAARDAALASGNQATALNPYNLGATNQAVLDGIFSVTEDKSTQQLENVRAIVEGPVFSLPGGNVRIAVGAEYLEESTDASTPAIGSFGATRDINSLFAELNVPIVGADNAMPGIHRLTFSASVRRDDYSDVGDSTNPKFGVTYEPVDWVQFRANAGSSFNAASIVDSTGTDFALALPAAFVQGQTAPWAVVLLGNRPGIQPQTADTYSIGADIQPPVLPGLELSATYYNIDLENVIGLLAGTNAGFTADTSPFLRDNLSCTDPTIAGLFGEPQLGVPLAVACALFNPPIAYVDWRVQNLGQIKQDGIDFSAAYTMPMSFGDVFASLSGSYTLNREVALVAGAQFVDDLKSPGSSRLFLSASAGADFGDLSATASLNHRQGYDLNPAITTTRFGTQREVDSFTTVDLFLNYDLPSYFGDESALTLNVDNLFDEDPPFFSGAGLSAGGFTNGSTLGRLVTLGIRTKL